MTDNFNTDAELFSKSLMHWHLQLNNRQMPWKGEKDPYKIWLSEIILQQTRVAQGWAYYERFINQFPTVTALANAADDAVFKLWEGLGYYSRCKNLLATSRIVASRPDASFPDSYAELLQLKGVGPYTASAIAAFAFDLPHAVVDGNVYRVLARYFGIETPTDTTEGKILFSNLAGRCLDKKQPAAYNQAIMDFGATVCTPASPACTECALRGGCKAFATGRVMQLPVKLKQVKERKRWFNYFIIESDGHVLIRKRSGKDIWENLHEFLLEETPAHKSWTNRSVMQSFKNAFEDSGLSRQDLPSFALHATEYIQKLTHQTIYFQFIHIRIKKLYTAPGGYVFVPKNEIGNLAFPKTISSYLEQSRLLDQL